MKTKINKIWGVALAVVILTSLLISVIPVHAGALDWTPLSSPTGAPFTILSKQADCSVIAQAPDGKTMFEYDNILHSLYRSTNSGATWSSTNLGNGLKGVVVQSCEDPGTTAWTVAANNAVSFDNDRKVGVRSVKNTLGAGFAGAGAAIAHRANSTTSGNTHYDLSGLDNPGFNQTSCTYISMWIKDSVGVAAAGGGNYAIVLTDTLAGAQTVNYTGALVANTWTRIQVGPFNNANLTQVNDFAFNSAAALPAGARNVWIDDVTATPGGDVTEIAISPNYATDGGLIVSTGKKVLRSQNMGANFGEVGTNISTVAGVSIAATAFITSCSFTQYYQGGDAYLVGYADPATPANGGVRLFTFQNLTWADMTAIGGWVASNVLDVRFSPKHQTDAELMVLSVNAAGATANETYVYTRFGSENWNATVTPCRVGVASAQITTGPTWGILNFTADYDWSAGNNILVGIAGATVPVGGTDYNDLYVAQGALNPTTSLSTDLNVNGISTPCSVKSVAVKGNYSGGAVMVGQWGGAGNAATTIRYAANLSAPVWLSSTKGPTGGNNGGSMVAMSPQANSTNVMFNNATTDGYAATTGDHSAFSLTTDSGVTFNGISLIEVQGVSTGTSPPPPPAAPEYNTISIVDYVPVDNNTMYIIMRDDADASNTVSDGSAISVPAGGGILVPDYFMVFKTTNAGAAWQLVFTKTTTLGTNGTLRFGNFGLGANTAGDALQYIAASPTYATDSTVYVVENGTRIWKSTNAGSTWVGLTNPAPISTFCLTDANTYYTGTYNGTSPQPTVGFFKAGRWTSPTQTDVINSIYAVPNGAIYIGTINGGVQKSTNDGASFSPVGSSLGVNHYVKVAVDADGKTIYATSAVNGAIDTNCGVYRWVDGTSTIWGLPIWQGTTANPTTTTSTADAFTISLPAAGGAANAVVTLTPAVAGNVGVTSTTATVSLTGGVYTITGTAVATTATVTALVPNASGTLAYTTLNTAATAVTLALVAGSSAGAYVTPATLPAVLGSAASFLLPSLGGTTTTVGTINLNPTDLKVSNGTLYVANWTANAGMARSVNPKGSTPELRNFQYIAQDMQNNAMMTDLQVVYDKASSTNTVYAIVNSVGAVASLTTAGVAANALDTDYDYWYRVMTFADNTTIQVTLTGPADGTITQGNVVTLTWNAISAPVTLTYAWQVATDSVFANIVFSGSTTGTAATIAPTPLSTQLIPGNTYWWRVMVSQFGTAVISSQWSAARTFIPQLPAPSLKSPDYGATGVAQRPTFSWLESTGADSYQLQIATNPFFAMPTVDMSPLAHTTWTAENDMDYGTTFYWRVKALKGSTVSSDWSESVFTVMTQPVPAQPIITIPPAAPQPTPIINLPTPVVIMPATTPPPSSPITPAIIWAIIIIGAVLVIAVVVLIVRTRRMP